MRKTDFDEIKKYLGCDFNRGHYADIEFAALETKYIKYLRSLCEKNGWRINAISKRPFDFSVFIKDKHDNQIFFSFGDARYFRDAWYKDIQLRMKTKRVYCSLPELRTNIAKLFQA